LNMKIYKDSSREHIICHQLFENRTYYVDFENSTDKEILSEIETSKLSNFIDWQLGNQYATLNITNFIGNIYFLGNTYDVKSSKFLTELSGSEQFQAILSDIQEISKNVIFSYSSPSFVLRQVDYKDTSPTLLIIFNYYKRIILDWGNATNLNSVIYRVLNNPNFKYVSQYNISNIEKIKKIDAKTIKSLINDNKHYAVINNTRTDLISLPITKFISQNSKEHFFPTKCTIKTKHLSYDTQENRFVKFFIEYIESIAYRLNNINDLPENIIKEKESILSFCRTILNKPFFKEIGQLVIMPTASTVLQSRPGYKDIYSHFTRSRFGIRHAFEEFQHEALSIDLKRISDLYELWVYYKISIAFLGNEIIIEQQDATFKDGQISYGICLKNNSTAVYYNRTESRSKKSAYSVSLRPDTTVEIKQQDKIIKLIFDAKYKVKNKNTSNGIERHVKPEDIYKMHTYLDAIEDCIFSVVIYPGSEMYFYQKGIDAPIRRDIESISSIEGVGAIPLAPNDQTLNSQFNDFINLIKKNLLLD